MLPTCLYSSPQLMSLNSPSFNYHLRLAKALQMFLALSSFRNHRPIFNHLLEDFTSIFTRTSILTEPNLNTNTTFPTNSLFPTSQFGGWHHIPAGHSNWNAQRSSEYIFSSATQPRSTSSIKSTSKKSTCSLFLKTRA